MIRHINNSVTVCLLAIIAVGAAIFIPMANAQTPFKFGWSAGVPYRFDFSGNGRVEMAIYNPETGEISVRLVSGEELCFNFQIALERFSEACADYDGDRKTDPAVMSTTSDEWIVMFSSGGYTPVHLTILFE